MTGDAIADPRRVLADLFRSAVTAAHPAAILQRHLPEPPRRGRTIVVGAGKAAAAMAEAFEAAWAGEVCGLVVTQAGQTARTRRIEVAFAAHPVPDAAGLAATRRIRDLVRGAGPDDLVVFLVSGGGSSLLVAPPPGVTLADKQALTRALLASGAAIHEMNCVRKHVSLVKGGRLAADSGAGRLVTLAISDIPGDDPSMIASGPTVPDATTRGDARAILRRYGVVPAEAIARWLEGDGCETPKPGDGCFARADFRLIASPAMALAAAADRARTLGLPTVVLGDAIEGEARVVGTVHAGIAKSMQAHGLPARAPALLMSGGETTVTVRGQGRGGRNTEFLLGLAQALDGRAGIHALAADTDGIDGAGDNAGAFLGPDFEQRLRAAGGSIATMLADNDAYTAFARTGDLFITGPTMTNVNDFRAILILPPEADRAPRRRKAHVS